VACVAPLPQTTSTRSVAGLTAVNMHRRTAAATSSSCRLSHATTVTRSIAVPYSAGAACNARSIPRAISITPAVPTSIRWIRSNV
jgi:hypothetical protein